MAGSNYHPTVTFWTKNGFDRDEAVTLRNVFGSLKIEQLVGKSDEYIRDTLNEQDSLTSVKINLAVVALQKERKLLSKRGGNDPMYEFWAKHLDDADDIKSLTNEFKGSTLEQMRHMSRDTLLAKLANVRLSDFVRKYILNVVLLQQNNHYKPANRHLSVIQPSPQSVSSRTPVHRHGRPSDSPPPRTPAGNHRVYAPPPEPPPERLVARNARESELRQLREIEERRFRHLQNRDLRNFYETMQRAH